MNSRRVPFLFLMLTIAATAAMIGCRMSPLDPKVELATGHSSGELRAPVEQPAQEPIFTEPGRHRAEIFPPKSNPHGASYGEWSAKWWQWAFSFRADAHPLLDTAPCDAGQTGRVWFLGGSFINTTVVRNCTVPAGVAILFPVLNTECSTFEGPPFHGDNEAELRACAAAVTNTGMFATIDGVAVQNLSRYRVQSPLYQFSAPDGGLFGVPVTDAKSVSDGVWLMLAPLSANRTHTIHFGGTQTAGDFPPLTLDVTYNITVVPGRKGGGRDHDDE